MSVLSVCRFQQTDKTDKNDKTDMLFLEVVVGKYADREKKERNLPNHRQALNRSRVSIIRECSESHSNNIVITY